MKKNLTILLLTLVVTIYASSQTIIPGGYVSGSWIKSGNPYLINGDIFISYGDTLIIGQGVRVVFQDNYEFSIEGSLIANGAPLDSICFTVADTTGYFNNTHKGWGGLSDMSWMTNLDYCIIEYSKTYCINTIDKIVINNSYLRNSFGGIFVDGALATMNNVIISDNRGHGINYLSGGGGGGAVLLNKFIIRNNTGNGIIMGGYMPYLNGTHGQIISNKSTGVYVGMTHEPTNACRLVDVVINKNGNINGLGGGIFNQSVCELDSAYLSENIALNGGGIYYKAVAAGGTEPLLVINNSIIDGNIANVKGGGICIEKPSNHFDISNSIIRNNQATDGGGLFLDFNSTSYHWYYPLFLNLNNIEISSNHATNFGGGIFLDVFDQLFFYAGGPKNLSHLTIINNVADNLGSGIYNSSEIPPYVVTEKLEFKNSIIWNNPGNGITDLHGTLYFSFCDIEDSWSGIGNINSDPLFKNPAMGNYNLMWANYPQSDYTKSPCIDTGDPTSSADPDGTTADMGAYPFSQNGYNLIELDVKVFLEGPFEDNQMIPFLNSLGLLPIHQPYFKSPWYHFGSESLDTIQNSNIIDWVFVEIRKKVILRILLVMNLFPDKQHC